MLARQDFTTVSVDIGLAHFAVMVAKSRYTNNIQDKSLIEPMKSRLQLSNHLRGIDRLTALPERPRRKRGETASNLFYEGGNGKSVPFEILFWQRFSIMKNNQTVSNYFDMIKNVCHALHTKLQPFLKNDAVDDIVIESQEASVEAVKLVGAAVQAFFETLKLTYGYTYHVRLSTGSVKLRVYDGPVRWREPIKAPDGHKFNKRYGEQHCKAILESWCADPEYAAEFKPWLDYWNSEEKKDDISDVLLQALYGLRMWQNHKVSADIVITKFDPTINSSARKPKPSAWKVKADLFGDEECQV